MTTSVHAQRLKKVRVDNYELFCKEEYTVLRKNKSIKHGHYKSTWVNGNPRQEGFYLHGKKDSLWTYFNRYKAIIASRGYYEKGKKVGIWEYFDINEKLINKYNHTTGVLSYSIAQDTLLEHTIQYNDSTFSTKLDRFPVFLPGPSEQFRIIRENIQYPEKAIENNIFGTVMISFFVDIYGNGTEHEVFKGIGGGCDEEALRVVKLIPDEWAPGIYQGQLVPVKVLIPITFQLN